MKKFPKEAGAVMSFISMLNINNYSFSPKTKDIVFFIFYLTALISGFIFKLSFLSAIFLSLGLIALWKVVSGLSWFNFFALFLGVIETRALFFLVKPLWLIVFVLVFLWFMREKIFSFPPEEIKFREYLFYYLFLGWIIISLSFYFFFNFSFWLSVCSYAFGLAIFSYFYFLFGDKIKKNFFPYFLVFLIFNLEFFLLFNFLSLGVILTSLLSVLIFKLLAYYFESLL